MSKKPMKSSLFRFVTLRSPQTIDDKKTKSSLILPSSDVKTNSVFYQAVSSVSEGDDTARRAALEGASFTALDSKKDLKAVSSRMEAMYKFSAWLMRNKELLSYDLVTSNLPESFLIQAGSAGFSDIRLSWIEETQLWDNLLYQTIYRTSASLRETFIQMIIANEFIKEFKTYHDDMTLNLGEGEIVTFTNEDEKEFTKRAKASVVIEKEVLISNADNDTPSPTIMPTATARFLQEGLKVASAEYSISSLDKATKELRKEEEVYNVKNQAKYEADLTKHEDTVKELLDKAKVVDPETGDISYPEADIPNFSFEPLPVDFQDSKGDVFARSEGDPKTTLSSETLEILEGIDFESANSFSDAFKLLEDAKAEEENYLASRNPNQSKTVAIGGSKITLRPTDLVNIKNYCYSGFLKKGFRISPQRAVIDLHMITGRTNSYINSATYTLVNDATSAVIPSPGTVLINNDALSIVFRFLFDGAVMTYGNYTFSGTLTFANGDVVDFSSPINYYFQLPTNGSVVEYPFNGCGALQGGGDPTDPTDPAVINPPTLKGVFNLGIADYRRVEQEICCYVPGEVSHIENILAREYKEKATRSLTSSEFTTEQTTEREFEQLSDTTSTERNELQTEASSIVDSQNSQTYGATTSVSIGKDKFRFGASASIGGSSSNSASLSDSEAQSYAQEVTERALERVVEKTTSRRTSRILREYEENNTHGFDNRKGSEHVTGVYRWVDKIYKNQIVNYGKRLMYEFAIPEPSRYLKEALLVTPDNNTSDLGLVIPQEPTHPSELSPAIHSSRDLTAANYQKVASEYNAEVLPKPKEFVRMGVSFSYTTPETMSAEWEEVAAEDREVEVPEGYKTTKTKVAMHYSVEPGRGTHVIVGNKKFSTSTTYDMTIPNYTETIPVSFSTMGHHSGSANVDILCQLTPEGLQQWQNETYNAIMDAYYDRVNEYNDFKRAEQDISTSSEGERMKFNPAFNRSLEMKEMKRLAVELLTKSTGITISKNNFVVADDKPQINANDAFEEHAAVVKFFEQAFDWEIMSYQLYPYFYADKSDWDQLVIEREDADPIFQAFLRSGMSRLVVPVRPGFETAVNWYMATGEIWEGQGLATDINDDLYLTIVDEMLEPQGEPVGEPWETQVPTSLTIVQAESAVLKESGLPCNPLCVEDNTISGSDSVISGDLDTNASSGVGIDTVGEDNNIV